MTRAVGKSDLGPGLGPDFSFEQKIYSREDEHGGGDLFEAAADLHVIGIDEAGRGPWAGPVSAAAAWIHPDAIDALPKGLNDSKKISARRRAEMFETLAALPREKFRYAVISISAKVIDRDGILPSTFAAMDEATAALGFAAEDALTLLVDGNLTPPFPMLTRRQVAPVRALPVIKGDSRSLSIAAASIMAKETRDRLMKALDREHPGYGWGSNMGYGTADHRQGLAKQGPTQHHRLSYRPVAMVAETFGYTR